VWVLNAHEKYSQLYIPGENSVAFKGKKSHYNTQSFVWTANPSPTFANSQTHESIHLYIMLVQTMAMHMTHKHTGTTSHNSHNLETFSRACVLTGSRWGDMILEIQSSWVPDLAQRLTILV